MSALDAVPAAIVEAALRTHLADDAAALIDLVASPISGDGFSGHRLYRVRLAWVSERQGIGPGSADWVVKRWLPNGPSEALLGVTRPLEALAWEEASCDGGHCRPVSWRRSSPHSATPPGRAPGS
jgi:hypothetical protein